MSAPRRPYRGLAALRATVRAESALLVTRPGVRFGRATARSLGLSYAVATLALSGVPLVRELGDVLALRAAELVAWAGAGFTALSLAAWWADPARPSAGLALLRGRAATLPVARGLAALGAALGAVLVPTALLALVAAAVVHRGAAVGPRLLVALGILAHGALVAALLVLGAAAAAHVHPRRPRTTLLALFALPPVLALLEPRVPTLTGLTRGLVGELLALGGAA